MLHLLSNIDLLSNTDLLSIASNAAMDTGIQISVLSL